MLICAVLRTAFVQSWGLLVVLSLFARSVAAGCAKPCAMGGSFHSCGAWTATFHQVAVQGQDLYTNRRHRPSSLMFCMAIQFVLLLS